MFLDRWYPPFRNFDSFIAVDAIKVKSHENSFLDERISASLDQLNLPRSKEGSGRSYWLARKGRKSWHGRITYPCLTLDRLLHTFSLFPLLVSPLCSPSPHGILENGPRTVCSGTLCVPMRLLAKVPCQQCHLSSDSKPWKYGRSCPCF